MNGFCDVALVFVDNGYTLDNMPEWRNGRRTRLKIWHPFGYTGSTPVSGTIQFIMHNSQCKMKTFFRLLDNEALRRDIRL